MTGVQKTGTKCSEKILLFEFGDEVALCCDRHLTAGFHFDDIHRVEWRVPSASVLVKKNVPLKERVMASAA